MKQLLTFNPAPFPELDEEVTTLGPDNMEYEWLGDTAESEYDNNRSAEWGDEFTDEEEELRRRSGRRPSSRSGVRRQSAPGRTTGSSRRGKFTPRQFRSPGAPESRIRPGIRPAPKTPWPSLGLSMRPRPFFPSRPIPLPVIPLLTHPLPGIRVLPDRFRMPPGTDITPPPSRRSDSDSDLRDDNGGSGSSSPQMPSPHEATGSEHVRWIQDCLNRSLGLTLSVDGLMNAETRSAVRMFQERQGLAITGLVGPDTEAALRAACALNPTSADTTAERSTQAELESSHSVSCTCPTCMRENAMNDQLTFEAEPFSGEDAFYTVQADAFETTHAWQEETRATDPQRVRWIQESLNRILGLALKVDGMIGPQTRSAIRRFQQREGLAADGIVGPKTEAALRLRSVVPVPATPPAARPPTDSLILIDRPTDDATLRAAFVANARSIDGLEAANPEHRAIWLELLGPTKGRWDLDRPFRVRQDPPGKYKTQGLSTCGLVAEGIWRRMKVDLPALYQPYLVGSAIGRAIGFARQVGAWIPADSNRRPVPGDYVVIGEKLQTHVLTCVNWENDTLVSIDGGQVGQRGLQAIQEKRRAWRPQGVVVYLDQRKVVGWVNVARLAYRDGAIQVPKSFQDGGMGTRTSSTKPLRLIRGNQGGIDREVASSALGVAALGVAVFDTVRSIATGGDLSVGSDMARYVHPATPAAIAFKRKSIEFRISAHHPRVGLDTQRFFFRLSFEYNGYDLRNAGVSVLRNKSSSLFASSFSIYFSASSYSQPSEPRTKIAFSVLNGQWDPVGLGDVAFSANPLFVLRADGGIDRGSLVSEKGWVTFDGFVPGTLTEIPLSPGASPPPQPANMQILRMGARGAAVTDLQIRLNRWLKSQGRQILDVDGKFGQRTQMVVVEFQQSAGLKADGIVGTKTWGILKKYW